MNDYYSSNEYFDTCYLSTPEFREPVENPMQVLEKAESRIARDYQYYLGRDPTRHEMANELAAVYKNL